MHLKFKLLAPSIFEVIILAVISIGLLLAGNSKQLLDYYGLNASNQLVQHSTSGAVNHGLGKLDGFGATDRIVTFVIWAVVGIFCFAIVQAIGGMYQEIKRDRELSSNKYVHPANFSRRQFQRQLGLDFSVLLVGLVVLAICLYGLIALILPTSENLGRNLLLHVSLQTIGQFLVGIVLLFAWFLILDIIIRLIAQRHRLTS